MKYNLFYAGYNRKNNVEQIGFLISDDLLNWEKIAKSPLVSIFEVERYTKNQVSNPCVICVDGVYKMWYQAKSEDGIFSVMHAVSKDLIFWEFKKEPVLTFGKGDGFRFGIQHPHVIYIDGVYKMWFTLTRSSKSVFGYAESENGVDWKILSEKILVPELNWEGENIMYPMVLKEEDMYKMWYTGRSSSSNYAIGYAESKNGVNWEKNNKPVILHFVLPKIIRKIFEFICKIFGIDFKIPLYGVGSPFVWKEGSKYFLLGHSIGTHGKLHISLFESVDGKKWFKKRNDILENVKFEQWNLFFQGDPYLYVK